MSDVNSSCPSAGVVLSDHPPRTVVGHGWGWQGRGPWRGGVPRFGPLGLVAAAVGGLWTRHRGKIIAAVVIISLLKLKKHLKKKKQRAEWAAAGHNVVVLHTYKRGKYCPHLSPFGLKLETYLRLADIKYEIETAVPKGPKGKTPWITINGEDIADSQIIMEQLAQRFEKSLSGQQTTEQLAIAHSFTIMADEHLYWSLLWWRYRGDPNKECFNLASWFPPKIVLLVFSWLFQGRVKKLLVTQGTGRHTDTEILNICRNGFKAISNYLGSKPFMMGEAPCEVDCSVFGILAQVVWNSPNSPFLTMVKEEFPNLHEYCLRMKQRVWPDWDKCLLPAR